jgi:hypothetical protein
MSRDPWLADLTLAEIEAAQRRSRRRTGRLTVPLLALAALQSCSAVWALTIGRDRLATFYAPGRLVVAALSGWSARRDARTHGVQVRVWPWVATAVVLLVLSASVSRWGSAHHHTIVEEVGPGTVFALGIILFGAWTGAARVVVAGVAMVMVSTAAPFVASGDACVALQLAAYAAVLATAARWSVARTTPQ